MLAGRSMRARGCVLAWILVAATNGCGESNAPTGVSESDTTAAPTDSVAASTTIGATSAGNGSASNATADSTATTDSATQTGEAGNTGDASTTIAGAAGGNVTDTAAAGAANLGTGSGGAASIAATNAGGASEANPNETVVDGVGSGGGTGSGEGAAANSAGSGAETLGSGGSDNAADDSAGDDTSSDSQSNALRGVSIAEWQGDQAEHCADVNTLGTSWYYNWSTTTGCDADAEFVPQVWADWNVETWLDSPAELAAAGATVVLGFNEPDHADQSNLSVEQVIGLWPEFDQPGLRIGSPATASDGQAWFEAFMTQVEAQSLRVDFIALHWYGWNAGSCDDVSGLETYVEWAEQWELPIWITEWSCRQQDQEVNRAFYAAALEMFARHPLIERFAWYLPRSSGDFAGAALLDASGNPTAFGQDYIAGP